MREIVYPTHLKETIASKGDLSYIRTARYGAPVPPTPPQPQPPITCIPTAVYFSINEPVKPSDVV